MDNKITNSEKLTLIRKNAGLNQSDFADKLGVKQSYYSDLERGKRDFTTKIIEALAKEFSISANWLLLDLGDMYLYDNIANSDNSTQIIKNNKDLIDNYLFGSLGSYEKRQIEFFDFYSLSSVKKIRHSKEEELKEIFEVRKNLADIFRSLIPNEERFAPSSNFDTYVKKIYSEVEEDLNEHGGSKDEKLIEILKILSIEEDKLHWVSAITIMTTYMDMHKKWILFKMKNHISNED